MRAEQKGSGPPPGAATPPTDHHHHDRVFPDSTGEDRQGASPEADVRLFLDVLYGGDTGFCHVVYGEGWYRENGKLRFRFWSETRERHAYAYPDDADAAVAKVLELSARCLDVYVSTSLMRTDVSREKNQTAELWCLHADIDHAGLNLDAVAELGWCAIASGTPGHYHLYIPLSGPITEAAFQMLQNPLVKLLGADAKKSGNDVLRPPATFNFKPTIDDGDPLPVGWAVRPTGRRINPRTLAAQAGVDLDHPAPPPGGAKANGEAKKTGERAKTEEFDLDKFPSVRGALNRVSGDRSADTYGVLAACYRAHLTFAQGCWCVYQSGRLTERLDERGEDHEIDLLRCWLRAIDDQQREAREDEQDDTQPAADYEKDVGKRLHDMRVLDEAKRRFATEKAGDAPMFEARLLADVPRFSPEESFRIKDLFPSDASMAINAQHKTGKTTFTLNLALSLFSGEKFLGKFGVHPVDGRIAILNYEVGDEQLGYWAREIGIPEDRFVQIGLRGRRNPFAHPDDLARLAEVLKGHEVESLIVDPFGQAYPGTNQDSAGEVGAWLADLNRWTRGSVGATDLIVNVHTGWNQERARGSTTLGDWPDSILYLTRDEKTDQRYLRATGRDVHLDEDKLDYDRDTRRLTLSGAGGRKYTRSQDKIEDLVDPVRAQAQKDPGVSQTKIVERLQELHRRGVIKFSFQERDVVDAIALAVKREKLRRERDGGNGSKYRHFFIEDNQPSPTTAKPSPSDGLKPPLTASIGGGGGRGGGTYEEYSGGGQTTTTTTTPLCGDKEKGIAPAAGGRWMSDRMHQVAEFVKGQDETTSQDLVEAGLANDIHQASQTLNDLCRSGRIDRLRRAVFGPPTHPIGEPTA
jgi:hypothetical protein